MATRSVLVLSLAGTASSLTWERITSRGARRFRRDHREGRAREQRPGRAPSPDLQGQKGFALREWWPGRDARLRWPDLERPSCQGASRAATPAHRDTHHTSHQAPQSTPRPSEGRETNGAGDQPRADPARANCTTLATAVSHTSPRFPEGSHLGSVTAWL